MGIKNGDGELGTPKVHSNTVNRLHKFVKHFQDVLVSRKGIFFGKIKNFES